MNDHRAELFDIDDRIRSIARHEQAYEGETRAYTRGGRSRYGTLREKCIYHADLDCPHIRTTALAVWPISTLRNFAFYAPCDHCTTSEEE